MGAEENCLYSIRQENINLLDISIDVANVLVSCSRVWLPDGVSLSIKIIIQVLDRESRGGNE